MRGNFILYPGEAREIIVPNSVLDEGEESFLKMLFQDDQTDVPGGDDYFVGLCGDAFDEDTTLTTLVGEPTAAGGYARKALERSVVGWPTVSAVNGVFRARSATLTWTPSGADFSTSFRRMFLCNVVSGAAGLLYSVSGAFPSAILLADGVSFPVAYEVYLR